MIKTPLSTMIGGAFWTPKATILGGTSKTFDQLIKSLFANGEQGFFYDPNDLTTMFQDAVGTVPVTGAGQPVGLMLDKSKGLVLGANLLPTYDLTTWVQVNATANVTANSFTTSGTGGVRKDSILTPNKWYKILVDIENTSAVNIYYSSNSSYIVTSGGRRIVEFYGLSDSANSLYFRNIAAGTTTVRSISVKELSGNHAYPTTSAARPILRQNATTGAYYLEFDGSDDFFVTNSIDFTSTDKVSMFVGVRKLSDTTTGILCELSASINDNNGAFNLFYNIGNYNLRTKGTIANTLTASPYAAPNSAVISASSQISTDVAKISVNSNRFSALLDQGTGNYGNYPLYIGRRAGTSLPFNGHIYSLIGVGRLTTEIETAAIEKKLAKRTGVTLSV